jgi:hypothetical protein
LKTRRCMQILGNLSKRKRELAAGGEFCGSVDLGIPVRPSFVVGDNLSHELRTGRRDQSVDSVTFIDSHASCFVSRSTKGEGDQAKAKPSSPWPSCPLVATSNKLPFTNPTLPALARASLHTTLFAKVVRSPRSSTHPTVIHLTWKDQLTRWLP